MKRSKQIEEALVEAVEKGLSLTRAAGTLKIHHKTAFRWRDEDEEFAARLKQAESKFVGRMLETVADQAKTDWRAGIELLARRFPTEFAKPESRLHVNLDETKPSPPSATLLECAKESGEFRRALRQVLEQAEAERFADPPPDSGTSMVKRSA